jgi:hypothetical protein
MGSMFGRRGKSLKELIGLQHEGLQELIRLQHEELRRWDEEARHRQEESSRRQEESRRRQEESRRRQEEWEEESRQWREESRQAIEKSNRAIEDFREFNREILLRNEKVYTSVLQRLELLAEEIREHRDETRAQTKALLRLLDRFDGPGGLAAA